MLYVKHTMNKCLVNTFDECPDMGLLSSGLQTWKSHLFTCISIIASAQSTSALATRAYLFDFNSLAPSECYACMVSCLTPLQSMFRVVICLLVSVLRVSALSGLSSVLWYESRFVEDGQIPKKERPPRVFLQYLAVSFALVSSGNDLAGAFEVNRVHSTLRIHQLRPSAQKLKSFFPRAKTVFEILFSNLKSHEQHMSSQ